MLTTVCTSHDSHVISVHGPDTITGVCSLHSCTKKRIIKFFTMPCICVCVCLRLSQMLTFETLLVKELQKQQSRAEFCDIVLQTRGWTSHTGS